MTRDDPTPPEVVLERALMPFFLPGAMCDHRWDRVRSRWAPRGNQWEPTAALVVLDGHPFEAELVGSLRGETWTWSFADDIGEPQSRIARALVDQWDHPCTDSEHFEFEGCPSELVLAFIGSVAASAGLSEASILVGEGGAAQLYALRPGQLDEPWLLDDLVHGIERQIRANYRVSATSVVLAAEQVGFACRETAEGLVIADGTGNHLDITVEMDEQELFWVRSFVHDLGLEAGTLAGSDVLADAPFLVLLASTATLDGDQPTSEHVSTFWQLLLDGSHASDPLTRAMFAEAMADPEPRLDALRAAPLDDATAFEPLLQHLDSHEPSSSRRVREALYNIAQNLLVDHARRGAPKRYLLQLRKDLKLNT